ncbi:ADP-ribosylation/crystallin J1 [Terrimonas sp. NA20]|uniref:ADP-ribosylation/crystallin J1 n=1 Tax=Terrimonas ginsenosidimutans TaxID=2908004 RepID=A0ABS9KTZ6_9BACT|nr:ADP-ribosylation/crystallin J1 [Terrimonas ginsenosidimutans]MCG2615767.1 ADP-ribosylation/crystallin J1 [Terrimonas ginsenosidimutans]
MKTVTLYRPVGIKELQLIEGSGWKEFPPRLFWQPIFYPVLNQPYAEQIANDWNTQDESSGYCGIVTRFDLAEKHYRLYETQNVGGEIHNELWVPAEDLKEFNRHISGTITIVNAFFGEKFVMPEHRALSLELIKFL